MRFSQTKFNYFFYLRKSQPPMTQRSQSFKATLWDVGLKDPQRSVQEQTCILHKFGAAAYGPGSGC